MTPVVRLCVAALAAAMVGCASTGPRVPSRPASISPSLQAQTHTDGAGVMRSKVEATGALMLETSSPALAEALSGNAGLQTARSEVTLAQAYMSHDVLDKASEHFGAAARLDPREGAAWDGLARVWREWGFPQIGLGDAYRAVHASPNDPAVHNTLGTILQALGRGPEARVRFAQAAGLNPAAPYALNNLCYSWLKDANVEAAVAECTRALEIDPGLAAARANLLLAAALAAQRTEKEPFP